MRKLFLVTFGGSPERAEICLYLNAAAGLYKDCEIYCYPIDKDTTSPNYLHTREMYEAYRDFREASEGSSLELTDMIRSESMFEDMLKNAGLDSQEESIQYLMSKMETRPEQDRRLLNACFTLEEQCYNMEGGYYGRANIGSVTGKVLMNKEIYQREELYQNILGSLKAGNELDVVIICSSFGGTGASLGINFGKFLHSSLQDKKNLQLHCIHIQPYFRFPDPDERDKHQIDYKQFIEKSAAVTAILAQEKNLIRRDDQKAVFDRFYYIGQKPFDEISDKNSAAREQNNRIHMVDMLVSLAVQDILQSRDSRGLQLYAYQYEANGTETLTWKHMPSGIGFEKKHVQMMRFCEFMLDCMEPLFEDGFAGYQTHRLIMHLYGTKGFLINKTADISKEADDKLREDIRKCVGFCRKYVQYWIELEESTRNGSTDGSVTSFFNLTELKRIASEQKSDTFEQRIRTENNSRLYETRGDSVEGVRQYTCLQIYEMLCGKDELYRIARTGAHVAGILTGWIYRMSEIDYADNDRN